MEEQERKEIERELFILRQKEPIFGVDEDE